MKTLHRAIALLACLLVAALLAAPSPAIGQILEVKAGDKIVTVVVTVTDPPPVVVPPPPPLAVWAFTASPSQLDAGQSSVLSFTIGSEDVRDVRIDGVTPVYTCLVDRCAGTLIVSPATSRTYELTSTTKAGTQYPTMYLALTITTPPPPPLAALLQKEHLVYAGSFLAPRGDKGCTGCRFGFPPIPGGALWYDEATRTLWAAGHAQYGVVGQMTVPELRDARLATPGLLTAALVQPFGDPTDGRFKTIGPLGGTGYMVGGIVTLGDRLGVNGYSYYDANGIQPASLFLGSLDLSIKTDAAGPFKIGTLLTGYTSGYIAAIPSAWRARLGGTHCVGQWGMSIVSRTSYGPACFTTAFAAAADGAITAAPLLYYTPKTPLGGYDIQTPFVNGTTKPGGMAWPEGTNSLLFFMRHGIGPFCYGSTCTPPLPSANYAPPYVNQVLAYNATDLLACRAAGSKCDPSSMQPYARWEFDFPIDKNERWIAGVAYDAARQRIYLSQQRGEATTIHVYQVRMP